MESFVQEKAQFVNYLERNFNQNVPLLLLLVLLLHTFSFNTISINIGSLMSTLTTPVLAAQVDY